MLHNRFNVGKNLAAVFIQTVKSPGLGQLFHLAAVNLLDVGTMNEIRQVLIRAVRPAFIFNCLHIGGTDAFNGAQGITDIAVFHRKVGTGFVNIRLQHLKTHLFAFFLIKKQFLGVGNIKRHNRAHEFNRVMRFQISRLVRNQRISSGV